MDQKKGEVQPLSGKEGMEKIGELLKDIRIAMMSTMNENDEIRSRRRRRTSLSAELYGSWHAAHRARWRIWCRIIM